MSSRPSSILSRALALLLAAITVACGGGSDPVEPPLVPGSVTPTTGAAAQTATVAGTVPEAPTVRVLSTTGQPMAGVTVSFAVTAGGGAVANATTQTQANGIASAGSWTLGTAIGANELTATVGSLPVVRFAATATASAPASLVLTGGGQSATVGTALPLAPSALVRDTHGNPVAGVTVSFLPAQGTVGTANVVTGADGRAQVSAWTLGTTAGAQTLTVTVPGGALAGEVTATAVPGPVATVTVSSGAGQSALPATTLPTPIAVRVVDAYGNGVGAASVSFVVLAGGGSVSSAVGTTSATGSAQTTWTLGPTEGAQTLTASVAGTPATVTVSATAGVNALAATSTEVLGARCAVQAIGALYCWGFNSTGQVGDGTAGFTATPTNIAVGGLAFRAVSMAPNHTCGLTTTSLAYCWGSGSGAELGDVVQDPNGRRLVPHPVVDGHTFTTIHAGVRFSCGLKADGSVWCWGYRTGGVEQGELVPRPTDFSNGLRFSAIATGADLCGLATDGILYCWSASVAGETPTPKPVAPEMRFRVISVATSLPYSRCSLTFDGSAYCWSRTSGSVPTAIAGAPALVQVDAGVGHACGVATDGSAYCWGNNGFGQLGRGMISTGDLAAQRVLAPDGVQFISIAAGVDQTCAVSTASRLYCWGRRQTGPGSPGPFVSEPVPTLIRAP